MFSIIWPVLVTNSPEEHPFISEKEKNYIVQSIQRDGQSKASKEEVSVVPKSIKCNGPMISDQNSVFDCASSIGPFSLSVNDRFGTSASTRASYLINWG